MTHLEYKTGTGNFIKARIINKFRTRSSRNQKKSCCRFEKVIKLRMILGLKEKDGRCAALRKKWNKKNLQDSNQKEIPQIQHQMVYF